MRRSIAGVGAAAVGAATTAAVLVFGTATGLAAPGASSAFGVAASGLIPIDPAPSVESTDGTDQSDSLVTVPLGELGEVAVAEVNAGNDTASVHLARVKLGMEDTGIEAKVINVACEGDTATVNIVDLTIGGEKIVLPPPDQNPVNAQVSPVPEVLSIIYNQQMTNDDGTFTVNGLVIDVGAGTQTVTLGSATCGGPADGNGDGDGPAPTPSPIETDLPVTG